MKRKTTWALSIALAVVLIGGIFLLVQHGKHQEENRQLQAAIDSIHPPATWVKTEENVIPAGILCSSWGSPCQSATLRFDAPSLTVQTLQNTIPGTTFSVNDDCMRNDRTIKCSAKASLGNFDVTITVRNKSGNIHEIGYSIRPLL